MAISPVERLRYEEMVLDITNKILITGKCGIRWVVEALEYIVIRNKKVPKKDHIPTPIYQRAKQLRELLKDKELYAREEDLPEYVAIVKNTVAGKIRSLLYMSNRDIKEQIKIDRQKLADSKKPKPVVSHLQTPRITVDSHEEVELKDQWRVNLMFPMDEEVNGLNEDEMARLCNLIDNDKYQWPNAMLLTANIPLAHWIASQDISELILRGILDCNNDEHIIYLAEPSISEMRRLSLLGPVLMQGLITVNEALELDLDQQAVDTLLDPELRNRLRTLPLSDEDYVELERIGVLTDEVQESFPPDSPSLTRSSSSLSV
ncbi:MAG: hypothetical protein AB7I18_04050 [Candidatus Berkiella sp.]